MLQTNRGDCIAGKPAPTSAHKPWANAPNMPMLEPACRCCFRHTAAPASLASQLPQVHTSHGQCANMPMWEPACRRCFRHTGATGSLASQLPQVHTSPWPMHQYAHVAAGLPAMLQTNPGDCIAGKPAPTSAHKPWANHGPIRPVGAGLPAMAAPAACYPCQPPPSAAYTSTNDNDTWAVLSTSAAWLASNAFCTVNTFRKSTVPWAYC